VWRGGYGVWSLEGGVRSVGFGVWSVEFGGRFSFQVSVKSE